MPTAIFDASLITFRARSKVLYGYNQNLKAAQVANYNTVLREQPTLQSSEIISTRQQGGCFCAQDASGIAFNRQTPGPCSCGR
jgi:hypothetical protein